jgi:phosphatidylethanolamine-binding protein (PEBP) family uncharacterized protein
LLLTKTPRDGYPESPRNPKFQKAEQGSESSDGKPSDDRSIAITFFNTKANPELEKAELYFEDRFFAKVGFDDDAVSVNTFIGHSWSVRKLDGSVVHSWVIDEKTKRRGTIEM